MLDSPDRAGRLAGPKRILIVSDSLGTPIHPRGIFHYTSNLIQALRACGHEITLLVETSGFHDEYTGGESPLYPIYEHLARKDFVGTYQPRRGIWGSLFRWLRLPTRPLALASLTGTSVLLGLPRAVKTASFENDGFRTPPEGLEHLRAVLRFVTCKAIYTVSSLGSTFGLWPSRIDAQGYDVVLVDTPSYFRFTLSPGASIVAVIHDLIPLIDTGMSPVYRRVFRRKLKATLAIATEFLYVSQTTRQAVVRQFPDVLNKPGGILHPTVARTFDSTAEIRPAVLFPKDGYFAVIASDEPRKNLEVIVQALALVPSGIRVKVIGHYTAERQASFVALEPRIEFLGYVSDAVKARTLAGTLGLIMPSFLEGFGIPLIEAAFSGKPVFCSDIPVFHEVMGDGAFYFDPHSPESLAQAIREYVAEPAKYHDRIAGARSECARRFGLQAFTDAVENYFGSAGKDELTRAGV